MLIKFFILLIILTKSPFLWAYNIEWLAINVDSKVIVHKGKVTELGLLAFKGSDVLNHSMVDIISVLADIDKSEQWVSRLIKAETIETISPLERIDYNLLNLPWPFSNRDFVFKISTTDSISTNGSLVLFKLKSVDHPLMPVQKGVVRGRVLQGYVKLNTQGNKQKTQLEIMMLVDPKGALPEWLVNFVNRYWAVKTINSLKKQLNNVAKNNDGQAG